MGYRSDVYIGTTKVFYENFLDHVDTLDAEMQYMSRVLKPVHTFTFDEVDYVGLYGSGIAFYEQVKFNLVNKSQNWCFVRIGQEMDDITYDGEPEFFGVFIERLIEFEKGAK